MGVIRETIGTLMDAVGSLGDLVSYAVEGTFGLFDSMMSVINQLPEYLSFLPDFMAAAITSLIGLQVTIRLVK